MSTIKAIAWAWDQSLSGDEKLVLLALASFGDHQTIRSLATRTGLPAENVADALDQLKLAALYPFPTSVTEPW